MWDQLGTAPFDNPCEKLHPAELLQIFRNEREQGEIFDLDCILGREVNVSKHEEEPDDMSLQAALMAATIPSKTFQPPQEAPVRITTGGASGLESVARRWHSVSQLRMNRICSTEF
jgi:hypothetical protein